MKTMKRKIRENHGITVVALTITVIVLLLITAIMMTNINIRYQSQALDKLSSDLQLLKSSVQQYYMQNKKYPIKGESIEDSVYEIDLSQLSGLTLNYGSKKEEKDFYSINITNGEISYEKGIEYKGQVYHNIVNQQVEDIEVSHVLKLINQKVIIQNDEGDKSDIILDKQSQVIPVDQNDSIEFEIETSLDGENITYQWYKNEEIIKEGKTTEGRISYKIDSTNIKNEDKYYCKLDYNDVIRVSTEIILDK